MKFEVFPHFSKKYFDKKAHFPILLVPHIRRDGRVVDCSSLENCRAARYPEFESLSLRHLIHNNPTTVGFFETIMAQRFEVYARRGKSLSLRHEKSKSPQ